MRTPLPNDRRRLGPALLLALLLAACGTDEAPTAPTAGEVAASYAAAVFTVHPGGEGPGTGGGAVELVLAPDGTATGRLLLSPQLAGGAAGEAVSFTGRWSVDRWRVTLVTQPATLLNSLAFTVAGPSLIAETRFGGDEVIRIRLERR